MGMFSFNQNAGETSETIARKRQIAQAMMQQGTDTSAIQHPLQGVARIAQALSGNWANSRLDRAEKGLKDEAEGKRKAASDSFSKVVASLMGGQPQTPPAGNVAQPGMAPMAPGGDTFQKMIQVESGGNPNAVSPKGATGIAQVMPATARDPGFSVPNIFDFAKKQGVQVADNSDATLQALLKNPQVNAGFGEAYFNAQKQRYGGDERLAAAAYNAGPGAVDKAGGVPNIQETQDYVRKLGLNGEQKPQVQPAGYQQPQPAAMQQAGGGDMSALVGLLSDPNLNEQQQGVLASILKQRMTPADPMQALNLKKTQLEIDKMQQPEQMSPEATARIALEREKFEYDKAQKDPAWEKLNDGTLFNKMTGDTKPVPGGEPVPEFKDVSSLRKEVQDTPQVKNYMQAAPIYRSMVETAGRDTRASDLNMVYGLGKIFDPTSVVREGEMVMVKNTGALPDWYQNAVSVFNGTSGLTPDLRAKIMTEARSRMEAYQAEADALKNQYSGIAQRNRINLDDVWQPLPQLNHFAPKQNSDWQDVGGGVKIRKKQ